MTALNEPEATFLDAHSRFCEILALSGALLSRSLRSELKLSHHAGESESGSEAEG